jgi:hypothetical protein
MGVLQYKDSSGNWVEIAAINQVIEAEGNKVWKEIEVPVISSQSNFQEFDCSAADINLLESDNWMLVCSTSEYGTPYGFYGVASKLQPIIITPIFARLQGEDMDNNFSRVGIYRPKLNGSTGYEYFGSEAYNRIDYAVSMNTGVSTQKSYRIYKDIIYTPATYENTAKLIYLGNKED